MAKHQHRAPIPLPDERSSELEVVRSNSELHPADGDASSFDPKTSAGAAVSHHLITVLILGMVGAIGYWAYETYRDASFFTLPGEDATSPFEAYAVSAQVDRVRFAIEVYFYIYSQYPLSLQELVDQGLLVESDVTYPPGSTTINYEKTGDTYSLRVERLVVRHVPADDPAAQPEPATNDADGGAGEDAGTPEPKPEEEQEPQKSKKRAKKKDSKGAKTKGADKTAEDAK